MNEIVKHEGDPMEVYSYNVVNGHPIRIYDENTDSGKTYRPGEYKGLSRYFILTASRYQYSKDIPGFVTKFLGATVTLMSDEEFLQWIEKNLDRLCFEGPSVNMDTGERRGPVPNQSPWTKTNRDLKETVLKMTNKGDLEEVD